MLGLMLECPFAQMHYMMPPSSSYLSYNDGSGSAMGMRHSASAVELPHSGGMGGSSEQQQYNQMFGLGAPMGPLANLQHLSSPRASQVCHLPYKRSTPPAPCRAIVLVRSGPQQPHCSTPAYQD